MKSYSVCLYLVSTLLVLSGCQSPSSSVLTTPITWNRATITENPPRKATDEDKQMIRSVARITGTHFDPPEMMAVAPTIVYIPMSESDIEALREETGGDFTKIASLVSDLREGSVCPTFPFEAKQRKENGSVELILKIDEGNILWTVVESATNQDFATTALQNMPHWQLKTKCSGYRRIKFTYILDGSGAAINWI